MSLRYLKSNRTKYRNILDRELIIGQSFTANDQQRGDVNDFALKIESCVNRLTSFCDKLEDTNEKISMAVAGMDCEDEMDELLAQDGTFTTSVIDCRDQLITLGKSIASDKPPSSNSSAVTITEERSRMEQMQLQMQQLLIDNQTLLMQQRQQTPNGMVKLPQLDMPTFNGDKMKWYEFWGTFETTIDRNETLSGVDKLKYLNSKLTGEAKQAISGIVLSNENYKVATDLLRERFGNQQTVVNAHYAELINLSPASNNIKSLRSLYDQVEKNLRCLEALNQDTNQDVFISMVTSKLPKDVLIQLELQKGSKCQWSVRNLRELINEYISARERAEQQVPTENRSTPPRPQRPTAEALVSGYKKLRSPNSQQPRTPCRYCNGPHWTDECPVYSTLDERRQRMKQNCYICLKRDHRANECAYGRSCRYCGQSNVHHRSLCPKRFGNVHNETVHLAEEHVQEDQEDTPDSETEVENALISSGEMVLMQTAKANIRNPTQDRQENGRILFDSGSQRTYITESLARKLNLKLGEMNEITLLTFGSEKAKSRKTPSTTLDIELKDGSVLKITVNVIPNITGPIQRRPFDTSCLKNWEYLWKENSLADTLPSECESSRIDILIGNDYYLDFILPQKVEIQPGLYMLGSKLGWILAGRASDIEKPTVEQSMLVITYGTEIQRETSFLTEVDTCLPTKPDLEDFWRLETIGIHDSPNDSRNEERKLLQHFNETIQYSEGRYNVTWPWKHDRTDLPENRGLAMGRLKSLIRRIKTNPELVKQYGDIIDEQLKRGVIEKVRDDTNTSGKHYIPHHAVVNQSKTSTKVRIVYDASAKTKKENKSLNECLYRGPVLLKDLTGILLRFRLQEIALVADIEKAFLQVGLSEDSRDVTRFLWLRDREKLYIQNNIQEYRFCRVPFGIISSPFLLAATLEFHLKHFNTLVAKQVKENIYVDNVITGSPTIENGKIFYNEAKQIFQEAGMNLRDWASNSKEVLSEIPDQDKSNSEKMKILGLSWTVSTDQMNVNINNTTGIEPMTKRTVLKQIASAFDPLGVFSPVILKGKVFLKTLWNQNVSWDEQLSLQNKSQWNDIKKELDGIPSSTFPRYIGFPEEKCSYQLVVFCDASKYAYAATVYLRQEIGSICRTDLIFSKTRLAPNKEVSIPRLELLAALIGKRCLRFVETELKLDIAQKHMWVDSQCVLYWLYSNKPLSIFVENRVKEIKELDNTCFHYISTKENPADMASRGTSLSDINGNELWWNGPSWLKRPMSEWPEWKYDKEDKDILTTAEVEHRKTKVMYEAKLVAGEGLARNTTDSECIDTPFDINIARFSSLSRLLRVTALVARFIAKLKKRDSSNGALEAEEIVSAEERWIVCIQNHYFSDIMKSISKNKANKHKDNLGLYVDEKGLLRCGGRLGMADIPESARHPLLLPKHEKFTNLVIENCHKKALHVGVSQTLGLLRHTYWIPHGRSVVKKILKSCTICRRHEGGPYRMPLMPPLPGKRVSHSTPFTYTGLDYFGPLFVKIKSETQKVWVCLFTCLATRAIHLELMQDMSTDQFLLGFRRFLSRHGKPKEIISDNAPQFKLASETFDQLWGMMVTHDDVTTYVANEKIKWKFIVELAPWMGGFYERLVGLVKRTLRKAIGKMRLTNDQLLTVLKEAEAVVNSRPLTYVGDDIQSNVTLTPAHFLTLNPNIGIPDIDLNNDADYNPNKSAAEKLLETWKKGHKLLDRFWQIWHNDYLLSLRERTQMKLKETRARSPFLATPGDVVLIKDELPRGNWRLGRIQKLVQSEDGEVRSAKVLLSTNKLIGRPLNLLYPIECPVKDTNTDEDNADVGRNLPNDNTQDSEQGEPRPKRQAAMRARDRIKESLNDS